ncbi:MAG: glycosyltransferase [Acidobacteria bacterium]|nr:glycosyltransferase [Acidobacteriota bacterium]
MDARKTPPDVSVIVPARNEENNIADCLSSLLQQGEGIEIIVADDDSQDHTADIVCRLAAQAPQLTLVEVPPLPESWIGKNHALDAGARQARGEWLLFTDADTRHIPGKLHQVVGRARREKLDLISFSPRQEAHAWWEKAVIPQVYRALAKLYPYQRVNDPSDLLAASNGQYILVRREVYFALGGHRAIRDAVLEDVELARRAKQAGYRLWFGSGEGVVSTRMYSRFQQMWEGWAKNLFLLYRRDHGAMGRARRTLLLRYLMPLLTGSLLFVPGAEMVFLPALASLFYLGWEHLVYWRELPRGQKSAALLLLPGATLFLLLLWDSERRYRRQKGIEWKGRHYRVVS